MEKSIVNLKSGINYASNSYMLTIGDESMLIDPSAACDITKIKGRLKYIVLTHIHFDHMLEIDSWVRNTDAEVIVSSEGTTALKNSTENCYKQFLMRDRGYDGEYRTVEDGERLTLGGEELTVWHIPGHCPSSIAVIGWDFAFVGDTIFDGGSFGRYDLPGGSFATLRASIRRLMTLPSQTVIYSGHGTSFLIEKYKHYIR
jgi:glyoxylase-like metal-dependent hydrolase (beta-lactamase superfamily II)